MSDELTIAVQAARAAGEILRAGYGHVGAITHKGAIDLVTEFDQRCEALILGQLRQAFPDHLFHGEESGQTGGQHASEWWIDPLDGTTNFAHGFPVFAVSIGLVRHGQLQMGVVYDPLRDELFTAEAGQGAALNGQPLRVSTQTDLGHSLLATGFPYNLRTNPHNNLAQFQHFILRAQGVRRPGSAALDLAWTAAGRLDGYWEFHLKPWDICAGLLLVREAGGRITDAAAGDSYLTGASVLASNGFIHDQMLAVLRDGDRAPQPA